MLWFVICVAVLLSLASLRGESARAAYYQEQLAKQNDGPTPPATVIVPVKGFDEGLAANLAALATLDYPDYELIVAARSIDDVDERCLPAPARLVLAGSRDASTGEKINNLLAAIAASRPESTILAFADSDGRVQPQWLRALVTALHTEGAGAATGYRWHIPNPPFGPASLLRSVWNSVIAGGMGSGNNRFAWGGATAIRTGTFRKLNVAAWWSGAISDDYRLSEAVRNAGLKIVFAPGALVASTDGTNGAEFLKWIRRQLAITRFYAPMLWRVALVAHIVYCAAMAGALWLALQGSPWAAAALAIQLGTGCWKGHTRTRLASLAMPAYRDWFRRYGLLHAALVPVGTWLWLYACIAAAWSNVIVWRGYRLRLRRLKPPA